jgi:hypothetical protein
LFGRQHVEIELTKLEKEGYHEVNFTNSQKNKLFKYGNENLAYPKGMDFYIKKRIENEKDCIGKVYKTKEFIDSANSIINNLEDLDKKVEQTGER